MKEGKKLGELAEQMFCVEVLKRGGVPCKPIGDSQPFDWLVCSKGVIHKVQVKSSWMSVLDRDGGRSGKRCRISIASGGKTKHCYTKSEIDFMAIWVEPFGAWMINPISKIGGRKTLTAYRADCERPCWSLLGL